MPSSAGQKLPAELWRHHRHGSGSPVLLSGGHEMQASPGLCDDLKQHSSPTRTMYFHQTQKRHHYTSNKGSSQPMLCRSSMDALDDLALSARPTSTSSCYSRSVDMSLLPQSSESDSNVEYSSHGGRDIRNSFAMDAASSAPPPSQVPLPPMEWLKPTSKSPLTVGRSLQAMLGCHVTP